MKDTGFKSKAVGNKTNDNSSKSSTSIKIDSAEKNLGTSQKPPAKVKVTQIFEFAGEEVKVEKEVCQSIFYKAEKLIIIYAVSG